MVSDTFLKFLAWIGLAIWTGTSAIDLLKLWEMKDRPHPMTMVALVIACLALLRSMQTGDKSG